jgi:ABC-type dipeptide/oligopeptide/nickel transport system permease component
MITHILRRTLIAIPVLLIVFTLVFFLARAMPGGPAVAILGDYASKESVEALEEQLGLDKPLLYQYGQFLYNLAKGNLGNSLVSGLPVAPQILKVLPYTLELSFLAIVIGLILGVPMGILTAIKRNAWVDYLGRVISLAGISVPIFFFAILMILAFSLELNVFPVMGGGDPNDLLDYIHHLVLPAMTMGLIMTAYLTRTTRSSMLNVLREDYIKTARAKGIKESKVIFDHALGNALIPVVSFTGVYAILLIGGSLMVEIVFSRPGLGKLMVGAIKQRDYMTVQSVMIVYATFVVFINLMTDIAYGLIDPRIRHQK